jgi:pSer/pThr/pTyr-binding forkhead associated (FHA) protein
MGVAKSIEQRLEGLVEGFFTKVFRSGLQPVEVGRRILREMGEQKTVSVNRVYAPNEFHVSMGPDDHGRFSQMEAALAREFSELVIDAAKQNRWNLMGLPRISFDLAEKMGRGEFKVEAGLAADPDRPAQPQVTTHAPSDSDPSDSRAISSDTASRLGVKGAGAVLVVVDDTGTATEKISVTRTPVVIGRMSSCDVVLADSNVSRRHAELRREGDEWIIEDLGSTNGTLVDGKLAKQHSLHGGETLGFGTSALRFELEP